MMSIELPCSVCKNTYPMDSLKCPKGSQSVVCRNCLSKSERPAMAGTGAGTGIKKPSLTNTKEWPVVGMSKQQLAEMEREKAKSGTGGQKPDGGRAEQFKCLDCGYRFTAHADSKVVKRCPYCSKMHVQKMINLVQDVDTIGTY